VVGVRSDLVFAALPVQPAKRTMRNTMATLALTTRPMVVASVFGVN
jgi:hypothetical protein